MNISKFKVLALKKALYGMKQVAWCWWLHLKEVLSLISFRSNNKDPSTYTLIKGADVSILWIHVDNRAITESSKELMERITHEINKKLQLKWDEKISSLVGISIEKVLQGYNFSQTDLIDKLSGLNPSNVTSKSPLPTDCKLESSPALIMDKPYLERIGMLLYIAQASRPDIAYAINYLVRFSMNTNTSHWEALEHLIAYIRGTRMSPISWQSKQQSMVASSTAQAEYMALSFAARECIWMSNLFQSILRDMIPTMLSDNKTAVGISTSLMNRKQTRHLIQEFNLINKYISCRKIRLEWLLQTISLPTS
ncbi:hypothetical protein O181_077942 [Austropuccinia psidii MF-1]|uniref:Reverse transcriptase Ty1/copia-type domain-containing protein n=1 Tax=Austropuccinia psidii MF-1 TaxID=1389203 RepID=A0A9Q3IF55_9BASI|nr:hypothetical protein [Austropuccinia psidii MF-1]